MSPEAVDELIEQLSIIREKGPAAAAVVIITPKHGQISVTNPGTTTPAHLINALASTIASVAQSHGLDEYEVMGDVARVLNEGFFQ